MNRRSALLLFAIVAAVVVAMPSLQHPGSVQADVTTFTVTSTADTDGATCGVDCTLRQAINAANANGNPEELDVIEFEILGAGPHIIGVASVLPTVSQAVHIRGESQPGASCGIPGRSILIEIREDSATAFNGIEMSHNGPLGSILSGVAVTNFAQNGVRITGGPHTLRCSHIGVDAAGTTVVANGFNGVSMSQATGATIGGDSTSARNVITGNETSQIFAVSVADGLTIKNNYFGVLADGLTRMPVSANDLNLSSSSNASISSNLFAGSPTSGAVFVQGTGSGHSFTGNTIGVDATGVAFSPRSTGGIQFTASAGRVITDHQVGGTAPGEGNRIVVGISAGVALHTIGTGVISGVAIRGNDIDATHPAGAMGIDLIPLSTNVGVVLPNDDLDADDGPNGLQNFPVLSAASDVISTVNGTLDSTPNQAFDIDIFAGDACGLDRTGKRYLGSVALQSNSGGHATFSASNLAAFGADEGISATATDAAGNTSEFSACLTVGTKTVTTLAPTEAVAGSADTLVTVTGTTFENGDTVTFAGDLVATTFVNPTTLQFTVTTAMKAAAGTVFVEVQGAAGQLEFQVTRSSSDVDCDNLVNADDAAFLLRALAGLEDPAGDCPLDANKSGGDADILDVLHVRREVAGLEEPLKSLFQ